MTRSTAIDTRSRTERVHRARSHDGTEIAGRVYGEGPPLVFVHGAVADGEVEWGALVPYLSDRYRCYLMSTRGRDLSDANSDLSTERLVQDVVGFVESIAEPVGLVGASSGGALALGAAARSSAISALAVYEPVVFEVMSAEASAGLSETVERMTEDVAQQRPADAARTFLEPILNDDERAALASSSDYFEAAARWIDVDLRELRQITEFQGPSPTDPASLARITAPAWLLLGSQTALRTWFADGIRHVADHVRDARVREIEGAGHLGPSLQPGAIAAALLRAFEGSHQRA